MRRSGLKDRFRTVQGLRFDVDLRLGRHRQVVDDLWALQRVDPGREDTAAKLMVALYRSDRQRDALDVFRATRAALQEDYGLEPGPTLQRLQQQILRGDPKLDLNGEVA